MSTNPPRPDRRLLYGALGLAVAAAALFWLFGRSGRPPLPPEALITPPPRTPSAEYAPPSSLPVVAALQTPNPTIVRPAATPKPVSVPQFVPAGTTVPPDRMRANLTSVRIMLSDFRTIAGGNPVGTNAEIMKAVMGDNKKHAILGPPEGMHLNAEGELLDPWGTPYFFHQISAQEMEIRSAGPDRVMWTDDDQVLK